MAGSPRIVELAGAPSRTPPPREPASQEFRISGLLGAVAGLVWFPSGLADFVSTGRLGVKVKEVQSPMANENRSVQAAVQPAAATGSMLDPLMDGERLLPRHMIAVENGDANLQLNRLVAAIKAETEESLSTLELRLAELTAAIKRRSDVELALTRARLMTAEAELSEVRPSRASGQRAAKRAQAEGAQGGTFRCEAAKPEEPRRRRTGVREGGRPLQRWL